MSLDDGGEPSTKLEALRVTLEMASVLAGEIATDTRLTRVIQAFQSLPSADREVIAAVLDREAQARRLSLGTENITGQSMHPNPNARLFLRVHASDPPRFDLERDEMMLAMLRGMRVAPILTVPEIHAEWVAATREALGHLDDPTRMTIADLLREVLRLLDTSDGVNGNGTVPRVARGTEAIK